jgi:hypothetical protein
VHYTFSRHNRKQLIRNERSSAPYGTKYSESTICLNVKNVNSLECFLILHAIRCGVFSTHATNPHSERPLAARLSTQSCSAGFNQIAGLAYRHGAATDNDAKFIAQVKHDRVEVHQFEAASLKRSQAKPSIACAYSRTAISVSRGSPGNAADIVLSVCARLKKATAYPGSGIPRVPFPHKKRCAVH